MVDDGETGFLDVVDVAIDGGLVGDFELFHEFFRGECVTMYQDGDKFQLLNDFWVEFFRHVF